MYKKIEYIILWILYFGLVTPIAIFLNKSRINLLNKEILFNQKSYWIVRSKNNKCNNRSNFYSQFIK